MQRLFDAINSGNLDELPLVVASDVVDHNAVIFMQPEGPDGVQEGVRMLLQGFPDLRLTTQELIAEGDQVVARFSMSGDQHAATAWLLRSKHRELGKHPRTARDRALLQPGAIGIDRRFRE